MTARSISRRTVLVSAAVVAAAGVVRAGTAGAAPGGPVALQVGRGIADMTGELLGAGMNGYGTLGQTTAGLHLRQRARAFVFVDPATGSRLVHVTAETGLMFQSIFEEVLRRLHGRFGDLYHRGNVLIGATHTHVGPGGNSHLIYDITALGFRPATFEANVAGILESICNAHDDIAPATVGVSRGLLGDAGVQRSAPSFENNPASDRATFPGAIDPNSVTLQVFRDGKLEGIVNWFATHATSMMSTNQLISTDNKGYAAYRWERETAGIDYLDNDNAFVAAFAQSNPGDISPNLDLQPGDGPTGDEFENTRIIGDRQFQAAFAQTSSGATGIGGGVDVRWRYVDMSNVAVRAEFTGDGQVHRTGPAMLGAAFAAGSQEDGGGGDDLPFDESERGGNPIVRAVNEQIFAVTPELRAIHAPKDILLPVGLIPGAVQQVHPFYLVRIGGLHIVALPFEPTIVSGLRLRRSVSAVLGVAEDSIIVQGYTNAYGHYLTTPEEYDEQNYEGGSTIFGRWQLPAVIQIMTEMAAAMRDGRPIDDGFAGPDATSNAPVSPIGQPLVDVAPLGLGFGDVTVEPAQAVSAGTQVRAVFVGANPNNNLRRGDTYLTVDRKTAGGWTRTADDGDWSTKLLVEQDGLATTITITWDIPAGQEPGTYRITYRGDARDISGRLTPINAATREFAVLR
ncbi:neutral/alkaline non-lysosomal ceramidase N-terminal domain-containing protein [Antrihabitans sp. YC2-6]|uniref:neutral/alkaline non-lysosomal ceramidase N-terminal domain-containing protein n=1 Tax=Antrihabitans sp. YC2-6 TaxID=2799498 RepID=UPI0018F5D761|nr:neutral/alkaline non-lysosomal ceramidase N-terminal domain-containing protein [Antrihabitans sp. YC2-6]MBJ8344727.1 neutral/alkaline ceramidase [Antrihabitans sp. YC2-6]